MRLASKIFLTSTLVIAVLAGVGALSLRAVDRLVTVNREITTVTVPALRLAASVREAIAALTRLEARTLVLSDGRYEKAWNERAALYATAPTLPLLVGAPLTGFLSDRVLNRRKAPFVTLASASFGLWAVFVATLGRLPLHGLYALFLAMGTVGGAFVLTWPIGREVNPPHLAGVAVAVVNLGGFLGAALTQAPIGALLDARWTGTLAEGSRVYSVDAYTAAFGACAALALAAALVSLALRETCGRNVYHELVRMAVRAEAPPRRRGER